MPTPQNGTDGEIYKSNKRRADLLIYICEKKEKRGDFHIMY